MEVILQNQPLGQKQPSFQNYTYYLSETKRDCENRLQLKTIHFVAIFLNPVTEMQAAQQQL